MYCTDKYAREYMQTTQYVHAMTSTSVLYRYARTCKHLNMHIVQIHTCKHLIQIVPLNNTYTYVMGCTVVTCSTSLTNITVNFLTYHTIYWDEKTI